ncbi:Cytochrome P450 52A5 [Yarrowia sp. C11]|nr:Cytochrome P450 52A5 [Yarrowia sp. E02]KAG5371585.1 Cytochrome P450 52A5 [Yarrowia sp. C11]
MIPLLLPLLIIPLTLFLLVINVQVNTIHRRYKEYRLNLARCPQRSAGLFGWWLIYAVVRSNRDRFYNTKIVDYFTKIRTFIISLGGELVIHTSESENIKALLATQFSDYDLGKTRHALLFTLMGDGIFTLDGQKWAHSRALLRPQFTKERVSHLSSLERSLQQLMEIARRRVALKGEVDVQELFFMLTMDTATDLLYGESVDSLGDELEEVMRQQHVIETTNHVTGKSSTTHVTENVSEKAPLLSSKVFHDNVYGDVGEKAGEKAFSRDQSTKSRESHTSDPHLSVSSVSEDIRKAYPAALTTALEFSAMRSKLQRFYWIWGDVLYRHKFHSAINTVHAFSNHFVHQALKLSPQELQLKSAEKYTFLYELAQSTRDANAIRDQLINILIAGRDTTAALLSFVFLCLTANPDKMTKLREAVEADFGSTVDTITFESLKRCVYLRYVLNEALRLCPPVPINMRQANKDTTLPTGGGKNRNEPIFVAKNQIVAYSVLFMHHNQNIWGPDASDFRPERWGEADCPKGWEYLPFNGGPRICLGQQYALTEAGYCIVRLLQEFDEIEWVDEKGLPVLFKTHITMSLGEGLRVSMK